MEKITVNVLGFSVLQQNFNRGDITFLTKKFWGRGKKTEKPGLTITTRNNRLHVKRDNNLRVIEYGLPLSF